MIKNVIEDFHKGKKTVAVLIPLAMTGVICIENMEL